MKKQFIVAISGWKGVGKTTLIERIIPVLNKKGLSVAVIKHDGHSFVPDPIDTDTGRVMKAGAFEAAVFDCEKFKIIKKGNVNLSFLISLFSDADIIIIEGLKHLPLLRIEVLGRQDTAVVSDSSLLIAIVSDNIADYGNIPVFRHDDAEALASLLIEKYQECI